MANMQVWLDRRGWTDAVVEFEQQATARETSDASLTCSFSKHPGMKVKTKLVFFIFGDYSSLDGSSIYCSTLYLLLADKECFTNSKQLSKNRGQT